MVDSSNNTNKEALNLFQALKSSNQLEVKSCLQTFSKYINNLCFREFSKELKDKFIFQWTFKNVFDIKEKEFECYGKANLIAANNSLKRIITHFNSTEINDYQIRLLTDFVCDLKPFILKFDQSQDYDWMLLNTNSHITNFYFDLLSNSFWSGNIGEHPEEKLVLSTAAPFFIRQAIEYKIKGILGIDYILLNCTTDVQFMKKCFKTVEANKKYYSVKFDFETIKTIFNWTHTYIHGGYRAEPWKTETAIHYLESIFYSGQTSNINSFSLYAGVEVDKSNLEELRINTEKTLRNLAEKDKKELFISWLSKPEVATVN